MKRSIKKRDLNRARKKLRWSATRRLRYDAKKHYALTGFDGIASRKTLFEELGIREIKLGRPEPYSMSVMERLGVREIQL
jgi:hypothetical protein